MTTALSLAQTSSHHICRNVVNLSAKDAVVLHSSFGILQWLAFAYSHA